MLYEISHFNLVSKESMLVWHWPYYMKEDLKQNGKDWIVLKGNTQRRNCVCDDCNQTFINADQLNEHIKENHLNTHTTVMWVVRDSPKTKYLQPQKEA